MKTSELEGAALDWAVLRALGHAEKDIHISTYGPLFGSGWLGVSVLGSGGAFQPHKNWAQGGPIIEREHIDIRHVSKRSRGWQARIDRRSTENAPITGQDKHFPLKAAMRCYVASKLGDTVDLPEELK